MITLVGGECISRLLSKLTVNLPCVVALILESLLNVHYYLVGRQVVVGEYRAIIDVPCIARNVTPRREPVAAVPIPVTAPVVAADVDYSIVMSPPPTAVMPRAVIATIQHMIVSPMLTAPPMTGELVRSRKSAIERMICRHSRGMLTFEPVARPGIHALLRTFT